MSVHGARFTVHSGSEFTVQSSGFKSVLPERGALHSNRCQITTTDDRTDPDRRFYRSRAPSTRAKGGMHMPRDLFGAITRPPAGAGSRSRFTVPLSLLTHAAALAAAVVVPLIATDTLPAPRRFLSVVVVRPVTPPEPPPPARVV